MPLPRPPPPPQKKKEKRSYMYMLLSECTCMTVNVYHVSICRRADKDRQTAERNAQCQLGRLPGVGEAQGRLILETLHRYPSIHDSVMQAHTHNPDKHTYTCIHVHTICKPTHKHTDAHKVLNT